MNRQCIEEFLYREADLLDRPDLDSWVNLFAENGIYWMPATEDQQDPINHISHIYDDRVMMEIRRRNFIHPRASSKEWEVRCSHVIGNVRVAPVDKDQVTTVTSNQHVVVWYREEQRLYACKVTHRLRIEGEGEDEDFKILEKRVDLINPSAPQQSLIIYL